MSRGRESLRESAREAGAGEHPFHRRLACRVVRPAQHRPLVDSGGTRARCSDLNEEEPLAVGAFTSRATLTTLRRAFPTHCEMRRPSTDPRIGPDPRRAGSVRVEPPDRDSVLAERFRRRERAAAAVLLRRDAGWSGPRCGEHRHRRDDRACPAPGHALPGGRIAKRDPVVAGEARPGEPSSGARECGRRSGRSRRDRDDHERDHEAASLRFHRAPACWRPRPASNRYGATRRTSASRGSESSRSCASLRRR
jgi:hypothetical protein